MRALLGSIFQRVVKSGHLVMIDPSGRRQDFGEQSAKPLTMRLNDRLVALDLVRNPQLKLGEAYMDGRISFEGGTIADFLDLIARNIGTGFGGGHLEWIAMFRNAVRRFAPRNSHARARRNVAHHYDLSGGLYDLFLDTDKQYSCAYFDTPQDSLETAQLNKKRHIAAKLDLKPSHKVLDIGSGWGGMGLHIAETAGADVTGITLSDEQLEVANERVAGARLAGRVRFRLEDYRHTQGTFDRIVSVGMFEHVGRGHYDEFFRQIASLLAEDGVALIHTIGRAEPPSTTAGFIAKYIFPGGALEDIGSSLQAAERAGFAVHDVEGWREHYALTTMRWCERLTARQDEATALVGPETYRIWVGYLAGVSLAFERGSLLLFQTLLARSPRGPSGLPPSRADLYR